MSSRVFVGTLYCGEGEFGLCSRAIRKQENVVVEHFVVKDKPEAEAHNKLWAAWREKKNDFDIFVKIDADTVLKNNNILSQIVGVFKSDSKITGMQCPLQDYFTSGPINGLNCFSKEVIFNDTKDSLFCDRNIDVNHNIVIKSDKVPAILSPAGWHCYHATDMQSFHYGLHRQLKNQNNIIKSVKNAWLMNEKDKRRGYALLGATFAKSFYGTNEFNYADKKFQIAFETCKLNYDQLITTV